VQKKREPPSGPTVLIEFDGVLHAHEGPPGDYHLYDENGHIIGFDPRPKGRCIPEGKKLLEEYLARGYAVVLFSDRVSWMDGLMGVRSWLKSQRIPHAHDLVVSSVWRQSCTAFVSSRAVPFRATGPP